MDMTVEQLRSELEAAKNENEGLRIERNIEQNLLIEAYKCVLLTRSEATLLYTAVKNMTANKEFQAVVNKINPTGGLI
jgi:hypothetical protein